MWESFVHNVEWVILLYYVGLHSIYFLLALIAACVIFRYRRKTTPDNLAPDLTGLEPPISIIIPAYNERESISHALLSALNQRYPHIEVIVVNDGSEDETLPFLLDRFSCTPTDRSPVSAIPSNPIRDVYASSEHDLLVIDKETGGKADALNAGVSYARHPYTCALDADSVLEPDSLQRCSQILMEHPETLGIGGTLLPLNGCTVNRHGFVDSVGITRNYWVLLQTIEYVRAFFFARLGWAPFNAMPAISGAFGVFNREYLTSIGGYRVDTSGEDLEITLRLHRWGRHQKRKYLIGYVPGPVVWTKVPDRYTTLQKQRIEWHLALSKDLSMNRGLLTAGGTIGTLTYPFLVLFEMITPFIEVTGYVSILIALLLNFLSLTSFLVLTAMVLCISLLLNTVALLVEEMAFQVFPRFRHLLTLGFYGVVDNLGFRQLYAFWKLIGITKWVWNPGTSLETDRALALREEYKEKAQV